MFVIRRGSVFNRRGRTSIVFILIRHIGCVIDTPFESVIFQEVTPRRRYCIRLFIHRMGCRLSGFGYAWAIFVEGCDVALSMGISGWVSYSVVSTVALNNESLSADETIVGH